MRYLFHLLRPLPRIVLALVMLVAWAACGNAAEVMPPKPARYFNDYANVVNAATAQALNKQLEDFEKATSSQIVVAVFPKMQSGSSIEDYANRIFNSWEVGQKDKKNGAILFAFIEDRKMRIEVGYGLEGALPDAIAKRIIEDEVKPRFRNNDYAGGLTAGVNAMLQATRGEYKGTGKTASGNTRKRGGVSIGMILVFLIIFLRIFSFARRGVVFGGRRSYRTAGWFVGGGGGGWSSGGGGGGFSGGGGSSGGGGASGSW